MKATVNLETKDVRVIVAKFLGLKEEQIVPMRYGFSVTGMSAAEIAVKIYGDEGEEETG